MSGTDTTAADDDDERPSLHTERGNSDSVVPDFEQALEQCPRVSHEAIDELLWLAENARSAVLGEGPRVARRAPTGLNPTALQAIADLLNRFDRGEDLIHSGLWAYLITGGALALDFKSGNESGPVSLVGFFSRLVRGVESVFVGFADVSEPERRVAVGGAEFGLILHTQVPMSVFGREVSLEEDYFLFVGDAAFRSYSVVLGDLRVKLPVYLRSMTYESHMGTNPRSGTFACRAKLNSVPTVAHALVTAKHVVGAASESIDLEPMGTGAVVMRCPEGIDAAFVIPSRGYPPADPKPLPAVRLVPPGLSVEIVGKSSATPQRSTVRGVADVGGIWDSPLLPARVDLTHGARPGDSGAAVLSVQPELRGLVGIYMGAYSSSRMNTRGGVSQLAHQVELLADAEFFEL